MKNALIVGGGGGKGAIIVDTLIDNGFNVVNIGSSQHPRAKNIVVDWKDLDIIFVQQNCKFDVSFDIVFFSQNSSSLSADNFKLGSKGTLENWKLIKDWSHSHWLSCQMPFLLLHTIKDNLTADTKVGWMLSSYVEHDIEGVSNHPDYSSFKFFNYQQTKCFSNMNDIKTFGIFPDFSNNDNDNILVNIVKEVIESNETEKYYKF